MAARTPCVSRSPASTRSRSTRASPGWLPPSSRSDLLKEARVTAGLFALSVASRSVVAVALRLWFTDGRIPMRYREWVHADVTGPNWLARFTIRALVQVFPLTLVLTLDSPWPLAIACGALGLVVGLYFAPSYAPESVDYRLTKYGYSRGSATEGRRARNAERERERQAKYDVAWRSSEE